MDADLRRHDGDGTACAPAGASIPAYRLRASWDRLYRPAIWLGLAITAVAYGQAATGVLPVPPRFDPIALRLGGWDVLAARVDAMRRDSGAGFVAGEPYGLAAELAFALPSGVIVAASESRWALFDVPPARLAGQTGLVVRPARYGPPDSACWQDVTLLADAVRANRQGMIEQYHLYRVHAVACEVATVMLPRPQ